MYVGDPPMTQPEIRFADAETLGEAQAAAEAFPAIRDSKKSKAACG